MILEHMRLRAGNRCAPVHRRARRQSHNADAANQRPDPGNGHRGMADYALRANPPYSGIRIAPGFIASPISLGVQSPPFSFLVTPVYVTTFISAIRPPPM